MPMQTPSTISLHQKELRYLILLPIRTIQEVDFILIFLGVEIKVIKDFKGRIQEADIIPLQR